MNSKANKDQIKILHTVKSKLGIDQDNWSAILSSYNVTTSPDLSFHQAAELISRLVSQAVDAGVWESKSRRRYEDYRGRRGWATPDQLRMLEAKWAEVSVAKTVEEKQKAFERFVRNRFGIGKPEWIPQYMVGKISFTLKIMKQQKELKDAETTDDIQRDNSNEDQTRSGCQDRGQCDCDDNIQSGVKKGVDVC